MVKVICIGDPHFQVNNIQEVEMFMTKLEELIISELPIDFIVCLGDILHTHEKLHTTPLNKAYEFIHMLRKHAFTYVLVGNHDMISERQFLNDNHWMNGMKEWNNVKIVDRVFSNYIENQLFVFAPYVSAGRFEEALNTLSEIDWKESEIIFAHQEFAGCKMGAIISVEGDNWPVTYPQIVSGHIHSRQIPQNNIYYTGSALQHAFGESEKNIIAILNTTGDKNYTKTEIDLGMPRKKTVYMNVEEIVSFEGHSKIDSDKLRISVSGDLEKFKALKKSSKYKELVDKGVKVVFKKDKLPKPKLENTTSVNFRDILQEIIQRKNDSFLFSIYDKIMNA